MNKKQLDDILHEVKTMEKDYVLNGNDISGLDDVNIDNTIRLVEKNIRQEGVKQDPFDDDDFNELIFGIMKLCHESDVIMDGPIQIMDMNTGKRWRFAPTKY